MDNFQNRHEEFLKLIDKTSKVLEDGLRDGKITQYEYDELKSLDIEYDKEKDPINLFKECICQLKIRPYYNRKLGHLG